MCQKSDTDGCCAVGTGLQKNVRRRLRACRALCLLVVLPACSPSSADKPVLTAGQNMVFETCTWHDAGSLFDPPGPGVTVEARAAQNTAAVAVTAEVGRRSAAFAETGILFSVDTNGLEPEAVAALPVSIEISLSWARDVPRMDPECSARAEIYIPGFLDASFRPVGFSDNGTGSAREQATLLLDCHPDNTPLRLGTLIANGSRIGVCVYADVACPEGDASCGPVTARATIDHIAIGFPEE